MSKVLITYATKHGSTKEIANMIASTIHEQSEIRDIQEVESIKQYDFIVMGTPIYNGQPLPTFTSFVKNNEFDLQEKDKAVFTVLWDNESGDRRQESLSIVERIIPGHIVNEYVFSGEIDKDRLNLQEEEVMRRHMDTMEKATESYSFISKKECEEFGQRINDMIH